MSPHLLLRNIANTPSPGGPFRSHPVPFTHTSKCQPKNGLTNPEHQRARRAPKARTKARVREDRYRRLDDKQAAIRNAARVFNTQETEDAWQDREVRLESTRARLPRDATQRHVRAQICRSRADTLVLGSRFKSVTLFLHQTRS